MFTYGIIGANGPIEGVSVSSFVSDKDWDIADQMEMQHGGDAEQHLVGVHKGQMQKRFASDGATETRYFRMAG